METYKNIELYNECCPWFKYDEVMQYITYAISHIAISIVETHSVDEHINLIQNFVHELRAKLLDYKGIKAECYGSSCLQLFDFVFPRQLSLSATYIVGAMVMILKYLEEDKNTDKAKLLESIIEECDRLEFLLA